MGATTATDHGLALDRNLIFSVSSGFRLLTPDDASSPQVSKGLAAGGAILSDPPRRPRKSILLVVEPDR